MKKTSTPDQNHCWERAILSVAPTIWGNTSRHSFSPRWEKHDVARRKNAHIVYCDCSCHTKGKRRRVCEPSRTNDQCIPAQKQTHNMASERLFDLVMILLRHWMWIWLQVYYALQFQNIYGWMPRDGCGWIWIWLHVDWALQHKNMTLGCRGTNLVGFGVDLK